MRRTPSRGLPADLAWEEASESFQAVIERSLRDSIRHPREDRPRFVELLTSDERGVVTITLPDGEGRCVPIFSTPLRAADYVQTLLISGRAVKWLSSTPLELVRMLRDLQDAGIGRFALDRCPRCDTFNTFGIASVSTAEDAIRCLLISKVIELARLDLYLGYAAAGARDGKLELAREVALETVAHVSLEDPRAHFLLGQIGAATGDRRLFREAKVFLRFLQLHSWERKLEEKTRSGSFDFELVG